MKSLLEKQQEIEELQREEAVLGKYLDLGYFTLNSPMNEISARIIQLEKEIQEQEGNDL